MTNKETGNRDGGRLAPVFSFFVIGRDSTLPRSFNSFLFLTATARAVELASDKENN
jgi:hypothetical protein